MKTQCAEISNKCNQEATAHLSMATFMRKVRDYPAMQKHIEQAMDWSIHADLMLSTACYFIHECEN